MMNIIKNILEYSFCYLCLRHKHRLSGNQRAMTRMFLHDPLAHFTSKNCTAKLVFELIQKIVLAREMSENKITEKTEADLQSISQILNFPMLYDELLKAAQDLPINLDPPRLEVKSDRSANMCHITFLGKVL